MRSNNPLADDIEKVVSAYADVKNSEASRKDDVIAGLRALKPEQLVALAYDACQLIDELDTQGFDYSVAMLEQHVERPGDTRCMWVVSQGDVNGAFNKMEKSFGATCEPRGEDGPKLSVHLAVFHTWEAAKGFLDAQPVGCAANRIYPVVVIAGREPRTTPPLSKS